MALDPNLRKILQKHHNDIASSVQLQHLLPILRDKGLVTDPEFESLLTTTAESSYEKNKKMVSIILQKGRKAFDLFVKALQNEKDHIGHKSLADTLVAARKELPRPRIPPRPHTQRSSTDDRDKWKHSVSENEAQQSDEKATTHVSLNY